MEYKLHSAYLNSCFYQPNVFQIKKIIFISLTLWTKWPCRFFFPPVFCFEAVPRFLPFSRRWRWCDFVGKKEEWCHRTVAWSWQVTDYFWRDIFIDFFLLLCFLFTHTSSLPPNPPTTHNPTPITSSWWKTSINCSLLLSLSQHPSALSERKNRRLI